MNQEQQSIISPSASVAESLNLKDRTDSVSLADTNATSALKSIKQQQQKNSNKKKNCCFKNKCKKQANKFTGNCQFCQHLYCTEHRLIEMHNCSQMSSAKRDLHKKNADKLAKEQTSDNRVVNAF
ncbi:hypothetical protein ACO0SA_004567 [Hanseniaspora valbyensis]|uniref:AN1-type domain-containing protein n=1 Tax=Hanseniaspora valbyensis NRRL Y-1626 TaxID=766949 RepID=A0A1B7TD66_9ASCO|nr:hypothetical protein HANVADRAFT_2607 [Hanseniaspora valbyensis NRRL Y-1626]